MTAADPVASRLLDRTGVCGARRGTFSQREKVTGRTFDRQIGSTKRGDRYADRRIRTGFAFDRPICYATGDRKWSSGESRLTMRWDASGFGETFGCGRRNRNWRTKEWMHRLPMISVRAVEEIFGAAETRSCPPADAWRAPGIGGPRVERDGGVALRVAGSRFAWSWVGLEGSRTRPTG